jgi:hypothetical protein
MKTKKYKVYWNVTIDGSDEQETLELKGFYESSKPTDEEVMLEVDADEDLIGEDFIGYPEDSEDHDIVWEGYPVVIEVNEDTIKNIVVTWKGFGAHGDREVTSVSIQAVSTETDLQLCERLFRDTNLYQGQLWDLIEPNLSPKRTHTALSVRDEVSIDGRRYVCAGIGWEPVV